MNICHKLTQRVNAWLDAPAVSAAQVQPFIRALKRRDTGFALALLFFAGLWIYTSSAFVALFVFIALYIHELGHLWATRSTGGKAAGIWLVPFLGGATIVTEMPENRWKRWLIFFMGPLWGFMVPIVMLIVYRVWMHGTLAQYYYHEVARGQFLHQAPFARSWLATIMVIANVGMLNLLPMFGVDGGRITEEITGALHTLYPRLTKACLFVVSICLAISMNSAFVGIVVLLGILGTLVRQEPDNKDRDMSGAERLIAFTLYTLLLLSHAAVYLTADSCSREWKERVDYVTFRGTN